MYEMKHSLLGEFRIYKEPICVFWYGIHISYHQYTRWASRLTGLRAEAVLDIGNKAFA
jgi:hypothetical protein